MKHQFDYNKPLIVNIISFFMAIIQSTNNHKGVQNKISRKLFLATRKS